MRHDRGPAAIAALLSLSGTERRILVLGPIMASLPVLQISVLFDDNNLSSMNSAAFLDRGKIVGIVQKSEMLWCIA